MQECVGEARVSMAALLPLSADDADQILRQTRARLPHETIDIANINSPKQVVLSGTSEAVDFAVALGKKELVGNLYGVASSSS